MNTLVDFPVKAEARPYLDAFAETAGEPDWLRRARRRGLSRFAEDGFPTRRSETWRYLDLRVLADKPRLPAPATAADATARERIARLGLPENGPRLVLIDGCFVPGLSSLVAQPQSWLGSMQAALAERPDLVRALLAMAPSDGARPFAELNTAFFGDGFVLQLEHGMVLEQPLHVVHLATGRQPEASFHTRSLIALGQECHVTVVETFAGEGSYWRNNAIELRVGDAAALDYVTVVEESASAVHLNDIAARLGQRARLSSCALLLGGGTVRHEANVTIAGDNAECRYDGAFVVSEGEEANIVTVIDHAALGGATGELVKGVAAGRGHGAFQGKIVVREGAQQTDARQTSRNLILGRRASIDTKPELEIFADDVKCAHGASVGELDEAALFYLRARGIPTEEARRLLVEGFLREPFEGVADAAIRDHLLRRLSLRLARLEEWA